MSTISCTAVRVAPAYPARNPATAIGSASSSPPVPPNGTSYATDLRIFATWCRQADIGLLTVKRSHPAPSSSRPAWGSP